MSAQLNLGDGILMKGFKSYFENGWVAFPAPKGKTAHHLFMWIGVYDDKDETKRATADDRLNTLGWVFDPKAAAAALAERRALGDGA